MDNTNAESPIHGKKRGRCRADEAGLFLRGGIHVHLLNGSEVSLPAHLNKVGEGILGIDATAKAPLQKLSNINPSRCGFRLEDPGLRFSDGFRQFPLRQPSVLSHLAQEHRHFLIDDGELAFCHKPHLSRRNELESVLDSEHTSVSGCRRRRWQQSDRLRAMLRLKNDTGDRQWPPELLIWQLAAQIVLLFCCSGLHLFVAIPSAAPGNGHSRTMRGNSGSGLILTVPWRRHLRHSFGGIVALRARSRVCLSGFCWHV